jgi:hypothetical protein
MAHSGAGGLFCGWQTAKAAIANSANQNIRRNALRLLTPYVLRELGTRYPVAGDNTVDAVRYSEPSPPAPPPAGEGSKGRVWINLTQYFDNVPPEVWGYHIGCYQVCQKWLKDRKGRQLSYDDLTHYRGIVAALARTIELQAVTDDAIGEWPMQ